MNRTVEKGHLASASRKEADGGLTGVVVGPPEQKGTLVLGRSWNSLDGGEREREKGRSEACSATRLWGSKQARPGSSVEAAGFSQDEF